MVVHIVLFAFHEEAKRAHIIEAKQKLESLMGTVPSLRSIDVGINFSDEDRAMDMSLIATFESKEALEAYAKHPEHLKVVAFFKEVCAYTKVVDYEREA